ncbi:MAG: YHS domain-containing protein, partial [Candidatus Omnitrophica bacterium]|nr:YHS domain-containing protein [Candidatus Omnitrophota bacterium]
MNKRIIIAALIMVFSTTAYVLAEEVNSANNEEKGSIMIQEKMETMDDMDQMDEMPGEEQMDSMMEAVDEESEDIIEVGNSVCPVSGEKVGMMGPAYKYEYNGKIYNLCCAGCVSSFQEDPEKYVAIVEKSMVQEE